MKLLIVGGGTGGHVSPGIAVARQMMQKDRKAEVRWVGTAPSIEADMVPKEGLPFESIQAAALKRSFSLGNLSMPWKVIRGISDSLKILNREKPAAVLATGGFVSLPMGLAAWMKGVPLIVHESNSIPGLANRVLGKLARRVCLSFGDEISLKAWAGKAVVTGNPVRLTGRLPTRVKACKAFGLSARKKTLFVFPGSRAAHAINMALGGALKPLAKFKNKLQVLWMSGLHDYTQAVRTARYFPLQVSVQSFIHDVALAYACADLVLARAGASTLAELTAVGLPAILVPYPYATGNHQAANARFLAQAGAAEVLEDSQLSAEVLAEKVSDLLENSKKLAAMAAASKKLGKPQAAAKVLEVIQEVRAERASVTL